MIHWDGWRRMGGGRGWVARIPLLCVLLLAGCQASRDLGPDDHGSGQPADLFASDGDTRRLASEPTIVVGRDADLPLDRVRGAVFFGDGIAIANSSSNEILFIDAAGRLVARSGRTGDGPGDYRYLAGLARHDRGLVAWDGYLSRVTLLDSLGGVVSLTKIFPRSGTEIVGAFGNSLLVRYAARGFPGEGAVGPLETRPDVEFSIVRLSDGAVTLEASRPGEEQWAQRKDGRGDGSRTHGGLQVIFGREAAAAVAGRHAYLATTDSLTITVYGESSDGTNVSLEQVRVMVEAGWEQFVRDSLRAHIEATPPGTIILDDGRNFMDVISEFRLALLDDLPARPTLPSFSALRGGRDGRLWIREYPTPMQNQVTWIALGDTWEVEERIRMPTAFRVMDLSDEAVIILAKGPFGEDLVEVYRVEG